MVRLLKVSIVRASSQILSERIAGRVENALSSYVFIFLLRHVVHIVSLGIILTSINQLLVLVSVDTLFKDRVYLFYSGYCLRSHVLCL